MSSFSESQSKCDPLQPSGPAPTPTPAGSESGLVSSALTTEVPAPAQAEYASALFRQFCTKFEKLGADTPLLDLGASTTGNVMYWVRAGHSVSAYDIMAHDDAEEIVLDYPDGFFGGDGVSR